MRLGLQLISNGLLVLVILSGCFSKRQPDQDLLTGTISYPFYEPQPLGYHHPEERFIIRSAVGQTEYTVEIPGAARDYDIEVPLADLGLGERAHPSLRPEGIGQPQVTDRELLAQLPRAEQLDREGLALMDAAFGVGHAEGPMQAPSYTLGIAKIVELYQSKKFEYCLIEVNNLLSFYPNSPRLLKMKGSVHLKLRDYVLAERAWAQAFDLEPDDLRLARSLEHLRDQNKRRVDRSALAH